MPHTINADGSATYSITVAGPVAVTVDDNGNTYRAGGATYVGSPDAPSGTDWLQQLAGHIAICDERDARAEATKNAARDALAAALYAADVAAVPGAAPWPVLADTDRGPYRVKADSLGSLGVSAVIA
jgi:hypothetical protein